MIRVENIVRIFGPTRALDGVSLGLGDGETVVLEGPSGSGKTTLLRLVAGFDRPDAGCVTIDGARASDARHVVAPSARGIAMVFQRPALWPHMTVAGNIVFALGHLSRAAARQRAAELLDAVELGDLAGRRPDELSAGQARRAALARALAPRARHVLMDEPLVNLDPALKQRMLALVRRETTDAGSALMYVAHDPDETAALAGRVVRLESGRRVGE